MRIYHGGRAPTPPPTRYVDGTMGSTSLNYWKLEKLSTIDEAQVFLNRKKYTYDDRSTEDDLQNLYIRAQRSLLCYQRLDDDELRKASIARALKGGTRRQLIQSLQDADDTGTFTLFLDLPPELRVQVYDFHLQSLEIADALPTQPPITQVSKLIRQETLPIFYNSHLFAIEVERRGISTSCHAFFLAPGSPKPMREQLTKFTLTADVDWDLWYTEHREFMFQSKESELACEYSTELEEEPRKRLESQIEDLLDTFQSRGPGLRLEFSDLKRFEELCEIS